MKQLKARFDKEKKTWTIDKEFKGWTKKRFIDHIKTLRELRETDRDFLNERIRLKSERTRQIHQNVKNLQTIDSLTYALGLVKREVLRLQLKYRELETQVDITQKDSLSLAE
jgi:hypothetical protein